MLAIIISPRTVKKGIWLNTHSFVSEALPGPHKKLHYLGGVLKCIWIPAMHVDYSCFCCTGGETEAGGGWTTCPRITSERQSQKEKPGSLPLKHTLPARFSKWSLPIKRISIPLELVRNAVSWVASQIFKSETLQVGFSNPGFKGLCLILMHAQVWELLLWSFLKHSDFWMWCLTA